MVQKHSETREQELISQMQNQLAQKDTEIIELKQQLVEARHIDIKYLNSLIYRKHINSKKYASQDKSECKKAEANNLYDGGQEDYLSYESAAITDGLVSPVVSDTGLRINEIHRSVVKGGLRQSMMKSDGNKITNFLASPLSLKLFDDQVQSKNMNKTEGHVGSSSAVKPQLMKSKPSSLTISNSDIDQNGFLEKLESLRTPSSKAFKKVLKKHSKIDCSHQADQQKLISESLSKSKSRCFFPQPNEPIPTSRAIKLGYETPLGGVNADSEDTVTFEHHRYVINPFIPLW